LLYNPASSRLLKPPTLRIDLSRELTFPFFTLQKLFEICYLEMAPTFKE
jgi:hypothetical protein